MKKKQNTLPTPMRLAPAAAGFTLASVFAVAPVQALEIELMDGEVTGAVDTTLSYGALWRVQGQDKNNDDINGNDGNRNFDTGLVSQVYKITTDISLEYQNYGAFVRGTAYYDTELWGSNNFGKESWQATQPSQAGTPANRFVNDAKDVSGRKAEILDAYVYGSWDIGDMPVDVRFGKQVLSWGEGLFYRNGINTTNPLDAAKFRLPGSELKEALVPVETLALSAGLTENLSMDAFYQFNYRRTEIDPVGTYFSETDLFAAGGNTAYSDFSGSALADVITAYEFTNFGGLAGITGNTKTDAANAISEVAAIGGDINPKDDGQFGISFRYVAEELNDTEFGFYFINYHSKEPTIYADLNEDFDGVDIEALASAVGGGTATAEAIATAGGLATVELLGNINANREYAEDVRVYGFSFNTTVGDTSFSGEVAYRPNMPIGMAATDDLLGDLVLQGADLANADNSNISGLDGVITVAGQALGRNGAVQNYDRVESWNLSLLAIHNFGPTLSFDSLFGVVEVASEHLRGSSLSYTDFGSNDRDYVGRGDCAYAEADTCDSDDQISRNAWGYSAVLAGNWNDVYAGVNLNPYVRWSQDIKGNSHLTGNFLEGSNAMTVGMDALYLNSLVVGVQYTEFTGPSTSSVRDRDNIGINVKYSF